MHFLFTIFLCSDTFPYNANPISTRAKDLGPEFVVHRIGADQGSTIQQFPFSVTLPAGSPA